MPSEVITLQLGNYANFVGSHFWNLQDEVLGYSEREEWWPYTAAVDSDVLYAAGEDRQGHLTYRPRALFVDLSGSLGGVRFTDDGTSVPAMNAGSLDLGAGVSTWGGGVEMHSAQPAPKSRFMQELEALAELADEEAGDEAAAEARQARLEESARELSVHPHSSSTAGTQPSVSGRTQAGVRYWTDYLKALLAPKSVYTLPGMWQGSAGFHGFGDGTELLAGSQGPEIRDELSDRLRNLGEACDQLQGFQMLVDDLSGFGGIAAYLADEINQEYGGSARPITLFALRPPDLTASDVEDGGMSQSRRALNEGLAATVLSEHCPVYIPSSPPTHPPPHMAYPPSSLFHTSGLLASAIDTAMLPVRIAGHADTPLGTPMGGTNFHSLVKLLQGHGRGGRNLTYFGLSLPAPHLPVDMQQLGAMADQRLQHPHGSGSTGRDQPTGHADSAGKASMAEGGVDHCLLSLTEGISNAPHACLAQSTSLRGPRTAAGPAHCSTAHSELSALSLRGPLRRCVQHLCVHPLPLLLPLPFPRMFTNMVGPNGDMRRAFPGHGSGLAAHSHGHSGSSPQEPPAGSSGAGSGVQASASASAGNQAQLAKPCAVHDVSSVPVMTRLAASGEFEGLLEQVAHRWKRAAGTAFGRSTLEGWGWSKGDAEETEEALLQAASGYAEGESDTEI